MPATPTVRRRFLDTSPEHGWSGILAPVLLAAAAVAAVAVEQGFRDHPVPVWALRAVAAALAACVLLLSFRRAAWRLTAVRGVDLACAVVIALGLTLELLGLPRTFLVAELGIAALAVAQLWRLNAVLSQRLRDPAVLFPASFLLLIAACTCLLKLPRATPEASPISWLDAFFTATSAVCVTGLTIRDTLSGFTPLGHAVILIFIQLGGLGVIIFGSTLALLVGGRLSFKQNVSLSAALDEYPTDRITAFIRFIVLTTLSLELIGAAILLPMWPEGTPLAQRAWLSLFHAVSAFCNAGFDITGGSMIPHRFNLLAHTAIAGLVVLGGLGYLTMQDLARYARAHLRARAARQRHLPTGPRPRLSVHTRITLTATAALYLLGLVLILAAQISTPPVHGGQPFWSHVLDAHFTSITTRTAGFATVPTDELAPGTRTVMMFLMLIGGSPGSTAGGLKTTTFAVLLLSVVATLRRREETEAFGRAIPDALVKKAATLAVCFLGIVGLCALGLSFTERQPFELVFFESVSAAATVGLSLGLTPDLTDPGKTIVACTMFLGRVGPLALFAALLSGRRDGQRFAYPHEGVSLG